VCKASTASQPCSGGRALVAGRLWPRSGGRPPVAAAATSCSQSAVTPPVTTGGAPAMECSICLEAVGPHTIASVCMQMECSICLEAVLAKEDQTARRFGLLDCEHCFCLPCIRGWRENTFADVDNATRACPECRVRSHFVTPSSVWPQSQACP
jgi:hypothetical protein